MKRAVGIAVLALALAFPVKAGTPYGEFLAHVADSSDRAGTLLAEADGPAIVGWSEDEQVWLLDHEPDVCYVGAWGRWLLITGIVYATGTAMEAGDLLTVVGLTEWMTGPVITGYADVLDRSTLECAQ